MAKRRTTLRVRIPPYQTPRNKWRKLIYNVVENERKRTNVIYRRSDKLALDIRLYLSGQAVLIHDIDNRLKDILDALQGRAGGTKRIPTMSPIIPNDRQIYRVCIKKKSPPKQSLGLGHLAIRKLSTGTR